MAEKLNFDIKDRANFPECTFKFIVYLLLYAAECVVLLSTYREFLTDPRAPWKGMIHFYAVLYFNCWPFYLLILNADTACSPKCIQLCTGTLTHKAFNLVGFVTFGLSSKVFFQASNFSLSCNHQ